MMQKNFLCNVNDIEPGKKKRFVIGNEAIMLANVDGEFYAVSDTCTHATASLTAGMLRGCEIECPRHGAKFDIKSGEVLVLPAVLPLKTYKLEVADNKIYVLLEASDSALKDTPVVTKTE